MGDVGEGPGMDKHWRALKQTGGPAKLGKGAKWQGCTQKARAMLTLNTLKGFWKAAEVYISRKSGVCLKDTL